MKKVLFTLIILLTACENQTQNSNLENQQWSFDSSTGDYIEWQSDNDFANEMTNAGFIHLYNFEYDKATVFFEKALEYDPSLFGPHVVLAGFSIDGSDKQKMHIEKAKENVMDNNETSKLFVSLLDVPTAAFWPLGNKNGHEIWKSMREIEPKGKLIHYYFAFTKPTNEEAIEEMNTLLKELVDNEGDKESLAVSGDHSYMVAPIYNTLGYLNYYIGEKTKSKEYFEKYIENYPNGHNPYDSMGEFYFNEGDMKNAKSFYLRAIEMYPSVSNAKEMVRKINDMENMQ